MKAACVLVPCALLASLGAPTWSWAGDRTPRPRGVAKEATSVQGGTKISSLTLSIALARSEVLVGESLVAKVRIHNGGAAEIQIDRSLDPTGFIESPRYRFLVWSLTGEVVGNLSYQMARMARHPEDNFPTEPRPTTPLPAGKSKEDRCDLAGLMTAPLIPGRYQVSLRYDSPQGIVESARVPFSVLVPRSVSVATVEGMTRSGSGQVLVHAPPAGGAAVLQREGRYDVPGDGIWFRRAELAAPAHAAAAAVAMELADNRYYRWIAWKDGETIQAGVGDSTGGWIVTLPATPLGTRSSQLHPIGWQPVPETSSFVALGQEADGSVALAEIACTLKTATVHKTRLALTALPSRWAARYRTDGGGAKLDLVTAQAAGEAVRVVRQTVPVGGGAAEKPVMLRDLHGKLAALALAPVAEPGADSVDVLLGPGPDGSTMTLQRLALDGGKVLGTWSFSPPGNATAKPSAWALVAKPLAEPVLLARFGDQLMVRRAGEGKQWAVLAEHAAGAEHLRLEVAEPAAVWAFWTDPAKGVQVLRVP
jgi:hypothetical protein